MSTEGTIVDLEPIGQDALKGPGEDQAERVFRGKRNRVLLGQPQTTDYLAELLKAGSLPSEDLAQLAAARYSILRVQPALTLLPDRDCVFTDADFSIELIGTLADGTAAAERPLARDVRPSEIREELRFTHTEKTSQEIGGEAGRSAGKLIARLARENSIEDEGSRYIRRLYGYGTRFYTPGWRLRATDASSLEGDIKNLEIIVQVPPDATLSGRFRIAATIAIQTAPGRWLPGPFAPHPAVLDTTYPLRP
jgi:hypothetical protein